MNLLAELSALLTPNELLQGKDIPERYYTPYAESPLAAPLAVARPDTLEKLVSTLAIAHQSACPVIPQGGFTGLAGGANPSPNSLVVAMERYCGIEEIDTAGATVTVRAGTPLSVVQAAVAEQGFTLGIDLGARDSCQIGGLIATNAGGNRAIRYGVMRDQVLGLEVILPDGTLVSSLNRMLKNNAGLDIKQLFIGSEGTLGLITRAVIKLYPALHTPVTCLLSVANAENVTALWRAARTHLPDLLSFEVMWPAFYQFMSSRMPDTPFPLPADDSFKVLLECASPIQTAEDLQSALTDTLGAWLESGLINDATVASNLDQARQLWHIREGLPMDNLPALLNFDVSLPIADIDPFVQRCTSKLLKTWPSVICLPFGHLGDSNLHLGISLNQETPNEEAQMAVCELVYRLIGEMGGTISAEHGIGRYKKAYLHHSRHAPEISLMQQFKQLLDPSGRMNPGCVL